MQRIIFVGVHYKPSMDALDSRTKSGKMIDRVIAGLQTEVGLFEAEFIKSNVFTTEYFPKNRTTELDNQWVEQWKERMKYRADDIVITLGHTVNEIFRKAKVPSIKIGHPSGVWSKLQKEEYIINVAIKVSEILKQPV